MVWTIRSCAMADLFQFGRTILEGIFRENLLGLPLWRYEHPGFWPHGSQELNGSVRCSGGAFIHYSTDSRITDRTTKPSTRPTSKAYGNRSPDLPIAADLVKYYLHLPRGTIKYGRPGKQIRNRRAGEDQSSAVHTAPRLWTRGHAGRSPSRPLARCATRAQLGPALSQRPRPFPRCTPQMRTVWSSLADAIM